jgi:hypothetical protein
MPVRSKTRRGELGRQQACRNAHGGRSQSNCAFFSAARNSREPRPCDGDATSNAPVPKRSKQGRHSTPARGRNMAGHQLRCSRSRRWQPESWLRAPPELSQFLVSYPIISISDKDERRMPFIRDLGQKANGLILK